MTNPMLAELDEVVRLMEAATTRDWEAARGCVYGPDPGPPHYPEVIADCGMGAEAAPRADAIAAAVNFLRTHHTTLADMAKRLEAAERDAGRATLEAERDFLHDWLQYAFYPVGMDCCGRGQGGDCCGDGVPVYATLPDVQQAMNKRLGEIEDAIAAIDATQEGEG